MMNTDKNAQACVGKLQLECTEIIQETEDVKTFEFTTTGDFSYFPGQFITLFVLIENVEYKRNYTISSSPSNLKNIGITVKRITDGLVSNWMFDQLSIGTQLASSTPCGDFHLWSGTRKKILLLSAGSGVTPMLSMVRYATELNLDLNIHFHHSGHKKADLIAFDELSALTAKNGIDTSYNLSQQNVFSGLFDSFYYGRISKSMISSICDDLLHRDVFICGPNGFMQTAKQILLEIGLSSDQIYQESFDTHAPIPHVELSDTAFHVEFSKSNISVQATPNEPILDVINKAGIDINHSCRAGVCDSCNSKLIYGDIIAPDARTLTPKDVYDGLFLPCCSFARSDLVIDL